MTVVIADSSPLNCLTLTGTVDVLRRLYGTVLVPQQVIAELMDPAAPHEVRGWALNLPDWIDVRAAVADDTSLLPLIRASAQQSPWHKPNGTFCC
jgi:predicted nucleic acid-binding protein